MLSDDMEKKSLLIGKHCMEQSEIVLSLCSLYNLFTTDLASYDSLCKYPTSIVNITLSKEEILQLVSFFSDNKSLQKVGFSESSVLFIAKQRKVKVAVMDMVTQSICDELGIDTINVRNKKSEIPETVKTAVDSNASRLRLLKIAACL